MKLKVSKFTGSGVSYTFDYSLYAGIHDHFEKNKSELKMSVLSQIKLYAKRFGYTDISVHVNAGCPSEHMIRYKLVDGKFVKTSSIA